MKGTLLLRHRLPARFAALQHSSFPHTGLGAGSHILTLQSLGVLAWLSAAKVSLNPSASEFSDAGAEHGHCSLTSWGETGSKTLPVH